MKPLKLNKMPTATITFELKLSRRLRFRLWAGQNLLQLAGRVLSCGVEIETTYAPTGRLPKAPKDGTGKR